MPRTKGSARAIQWRGAWYIFYTDHVTGKKRRVSCTNHGARNAEQRKVLVDQFSSLEVNDHAETVMRGGAITGDVTVYSEVTEYLKYEEERAETREDNPESGVGISRSSLTLRTTTFKHFQKWLEDEELAGLLTKDMTADILARYFRWVTSEPKGRGSGSKTGKRRSAATINQKKRHMKMCLNWIDLRRPSRFRDFKPLLAALKLTKGIKKAPVSFSASELSAYAQAALERENPERVVGVRPHVGGRKKRIYEQRASKTVSTPVTRLFLLLALTGCRLSEALELKWKDVDLNRGTLTIHAKKTRGLRWLPLIDDPAAEVAPKLVEVLRLWYAEDKQREYVLPHLDGAVPIFAKKVWQKIGEAAWKKIGKAKDAVSIGPQRLRQNFTSYAAAMGVPAAVGAQWQGHGAAVAEQFYRAQVLNRDPNAKTFEQAMGLEEFVQQQIDELTQKLDSKEVPRLEDTKSKSSV